MTSTADRFHREAQQALEQANAEKLCQLICGEQFVLIRTDRVESSDAELLGVLTAEFANHPYLVAFSDADQATAFVDQRRDLFEEVDEVDGYLVAGQTMLDYLDDGYGLTIDPDTDLEIQVKPNLVSRLLDEFAQ